MPEDKKKANLRLGLLWITHHQKKNLRLGLLWITHHQKKIEPYYLHNFTEDLKLPQSATRLHPEVSKGEKI